MGGANRLGLLLLLVALYFIYTTLVRAGLPAPWPEVIGIAIFIPALYFMLLRPMMRPVSSYSYRCPRCNSRIGNTEYREAREGDGLFVCHMCGTILRHPLVK